MKRNKPYLPILIVDDEEQFLLSVSMTLKSAGYNNVETCSDSRQVMKQLSEQEYMLVLMDVMMPHISGLQLVPQVVRDYPHLPLIIITAVNDVETAVKCMKAGAIDYIVKPVGKSRVVSTVRRAIELREVQNEAERLKEYLLSDKLENPQAFRSIITRNSNMRAIFQYTEAISQTSMPVLITGETGVGKELIARAIHDVSGREGQFVAVNVAGLDDNLFSDTLFGHKKGAFTGADEARRGLIEQAAEGTLFLDEIGDLSPESQVKLLRLLQEGRYFPLGSDIPSVTDARVVVATNQDLNSMQENGQFRRDLYYRLKTHHISLPPLRDRKDDIPLIADFFLQKAADDIGKKKPSAPRELFTLLKTYHFPGNIRELEGMIFDAVSQHKGGILALDSFHQKVGFPDERVPPAPPLDEPAAFANAEGNLFGEKLPSLKELEQLLIDEALMRADGNQTVAARLIGMSRKALNNRLIRARK